MPASALKSSIKDYFDTKKQILDKIGDLSGYEIAHNEVLCAIYLRPEYSPGGIALTHTNLKEDLFQAKAHLVLKIGPGCVFKNMDVKLHDWVVLRPSDAWALDVNTRPDVLDRKDFVPCRMVYDDMIRARISHPSIVW
jgi:hypothetical protein